MRRRRRRFALSLEQHLAAGGLAIAATHADLGMPAARTLELGTLRLEGA